MTRGRGWAYTGVTLGAVTSVAANVAHSYVPPAGAPDSWQPHGGAVVGAVFWPVALVVAIEILARTPWPDGARWTWLRYGGIVPVAAVAAVVSYRHMAGLLAFYGEDPVTSLIGPLAVDGLMVMATAALLATGRSPATNVAADATTPATVTDTTPDTTPAIASPAVASDTTPPKAPRKPASGDNRAAIARTRTRHPHMTQKAVAAATGMSVRTVARHWPHTTPLTAVKEA